NHLQDLALMGPVALVAYVLIRLSGRAPVVAFALGAGLALLFSVSTYHRSAVFRDDITLWTSVVKDEPGSAFARNNLAAFLLDQGRRSDALEQLEAAANVSRDPAERHRYRSQWHLYSGRKGEAAEEARLAIRSGGNREVRHQAALVLGEAGQVDESIGAYRALVREFPNSSTYSYELGAALARSGRLPEAADVLRRYCERRPGNPAMEEALALTLLRLGFRDEARERAAVVMGVDATDPLAAEQLARWEWSLSKPPPSPGGGDGGAGDR
ncbi:MAG TPA: tetratricopeptide repeat protein, partial [Candidatus Deferrimicrobiaceae bacterium]